MTSTLPSYHVKLRDLRRRLGELPGAVVAFSGGVDSSMLLHVCREVLGDAVVAVTADSPSLPRAELDESRELATAMEVRHVVLATNELDQPDYQRNGSDRCYYCKQELFVTVAERRREVGPADWPVLYGAILDDLGDHRPGQKAAAEHGVLAPLVDSEFTKEDVRRYSREVGLSTADKQSFACLSSRVMHGTPIDAALLGRLERAEAVVRELGFKQFRVRHHGNLARLEVGPDELAVAVTHRAALTAGIKAAGYSFVAVDLQGYRSGSMNEVKS